MIGRQDELGILNSLYKSKKFEYLVMYGRRRVGKTTLLKEFAKDKNAIFFSAQEKNDALNLQDFPKWFRYEFTNNAYYEMLGADAASKEIMDGISDYMGEAFEGICMEYFVRKAKKVSCLLYRIRLENGGGIIRILRHRMM